ncbi:MAG TPA: response regulator [Elusimicrobiota bacterium]|nr:response regulator [Elusimicrobiota bacterium]
MARILAADDDPETLEYIKMALEMGGHEVTTACDGRQALEAGKAGDFQMYVLDVTMPFLDGYHVAEQLSEKFPERPILLLTSRDYEKDKVAVESCGADAHMSKPFDVNEFLRVIREMTSGKREG